MCMGEWLVLRMCVFLRMCLLSSCHLSFAVFGNLEFHILLFAISLFCRDTLGDLWAHFQGQKIA